MCGMHRSLQLVLTSLLPWMGKKVGARTQSGVKDTNDQGSDLGGNLFLSAEG